MNLTIQEIKQVVGNQAGGLETQQITGVEFDSRLIQSGSLFVPLAGTRDGHEFIDQAIQNGATATLWSRDAAGAPKDIYVIFVEDTTVAFQELAKYYLRKIAPKVVGITGSNGKTTTKDMTEAVLSQKYVTYKTQGNYNNDLGMPYTILHMPSNTQLLILEMGMDHAGDLTFLSEFAEPDVAAITMIGEAHIENLGSRHGIALAKMEITAGLAKKGLLLIPSDEPLLTPLVSTLSQTVQTFGLETGELHAKIINETKDQTTFTIQNQTYSIPVLGGYNVKNALIAYGIGRYYDVSESSIAKGLGTFQLTKNRTQWLKSSNGADILSDVYNANPTAMGLVLDSFGRLEVIGRRMAVLADMLELGPDSLKMHRQMSEHIAGNYDLVLLYGTQMNALYTELKEKEQPVLYFPLGDKQELIATVRQVMRATDSIVLKGSNGMGLIEVVEALTKDEL